MKTKTLPAIAMAMMMAGANAQNPAMTLTFTAYYQGEAIAPDSIFIQNLTQGGDTMLYAQDTIFIFDITTGFAEPIKSADETFEVRKNIPNPFEDMTSVSVLIAEKGYIEMAIRNIMGQNIAFYAGTLEAGTHRFSFYPGNDRFYLLSAFFNEETRSIKMISNGSRLSGEGSLVYSGTEQYQPAYKDKTKKGGFIFSLGDLLRFTGYATTPTMNIGNNEIEDIPEENTTYIINIHEGIRCPGIPTLTDIDSNAYNTVLIDNQCWMKENLKTTTYKNGTPIPNVTNGYSWSSLTTGAYVWFDNDISWKDVYGALYNWYAAVNANGLCPTGWHFPSNSEWDVLVNNLGGSSVAGGKMKTTGTTHWNSPNTGATNESGYSGLPGGSRNSVGGAPFLNLGYNGTWWSSTEQSLYYAWSRYLGYDFGGVYEYYYDKQTGYYIRCLRD